VSTAGIISAWSERLIGARASDPATISAYHRETRDLIAARLPVSTVIFLAFMAVAYVIEWAYFPERWLPLTSCYGVFVASCAIALPAARKAPQHAVTIAVLLSVWLALCLTAYLALVHGSGELCLFGLIGFLTGVVVQFPWGVPGQLTVVGGVLFAHVLSLLIGVDNALPIPYGTFALVTHASMTVLGAELLDRYRFSAFRGACESERANASKSEFLATVSHELRTPLNIILGYTDLLIEGAFDSEPERRDALQRVRQQSRQLLDLIQGMLDLNRLEIGGIRLVVETFAVAELLDQLRRNLPANWAKASVELQWRDSVPELTMRSDRGKLESILRNLIHNALKYTEEGAVTVTAERDGAGRVRFTVADTGQGIADDDMPRIFEMFRQGNSGPPRGGGVGLGLYIVSRLTQVLGGEIDVDSRIGAGSRFTVSVPLDAPAAPLPDAAVEKLEDTLRRAQGERKRFL
jgi:signal transduction histidine kinase